MSTLFLSTRRKCSFTSIVALAARTMSTTATPRPYYFHVGASWAGKPDEKPTFPRRGRKTTMSGFRQDTDIGRWTRQSLSQFTSPARERSPGEDFFYVQEVRCFSDTIMSWNFMYRPYTLRCATSRWVSICLYSARAGSNTCVTRVVGSIARRSRRGRRMG